MASGPITSWQIDGETMETVTDFIFLGSKITAYGDCSHEIKRCLLLGRKALTNPHSILKSRDITADKDPYNQSFDFSSSHVQMWELDHEEGWAPKDWCFQSVVLEKILESPLNSKEIKPVNPKGNQPWIFMARLMLKLKLQYFGNLIWRANSLEKTLMLLKIDDKMRRGWWRMKYLDSITDSLDVSLSNLGDSECQESLASSVHGVTKNGTWLSDWTTTVFLGTMMSGSRTVVLWDKTVKVFCCIWAWLSLLIGSEKKAS